MTLPSKERRLQITRDLLDVLNALGSTPDVAEAIALHICEYDADGEAAFAQSQVLILRDSGHPAFSFLTGRFVMHIDKSVKLNHSNMVGSQIGSPGAKINSQNMQLLQGEIVSAGSLDQSGAECFQSLLNEVPQIDDESNRETVVKQLTELVRELKTDKPNTGIVSKCWSAVVSAAKGLPSLAAAAAWLQAKFPGVLAAIGAL